MLKKNKKPIKVIKNIVIIISIPGMLIGKQLLGLIFEGSKSEEIFIKNLLKYNVNPIGTKTIMPVKK